MDTARLSRLVAGATLMALIAFGAPACGEDPVAPELGGSGHATVTLSQLEGGSASLSAASVEPQSGYGQVSLEAVSSIVVKVTRVQAHRAGLDDEEEGDGNGEGEENGGPAWVDLSVETQEIDLISDLADGETITVAEGEVPGGEYDQLRLFVEGATVTFTEPQTVPGASDQTVTEAELRIPSAAQTGIKIPGASFTVEDGSATSVAVEFDTGTSVQNIVITGTGQVIMAPVLVGEGGDAADDEEESSGS